MSSGLEVLRVPFLDLRPMHGAVAQAILDDVAEVIESGAFTNGPAVHTFEEAFASYCGVAECVGMGSGLDALRLGLAALGVTAGDEVIVPASTFVASFEAVSQVGATPVPVDVREEDWNLDPEAVAKAIGPRTRAIMPVHLYGQLADMRRLIPLADRHGLALVEDAAQAHGAWRDGIRAGAASSVAAFSFYPGKNLGAMGDAGAALTDDSRLAGTLRQLREHGQRRKYEHALIGWTSRLDTIQAIALLHKLPLLDGWNCQRASVAAAYSKQLAGVGDLRLPPVPVDSQPVWHLYPIRTADPEALMRSLREAGVATGRHYPTPPHLSPSYRTLGYGPGTFPIAEAIAAEEVSLPIFPGMLKTQVDIVVDAIVDYFDRG